MERFTGFSPFARKSASVNSTKRPVCGRKLRDVASTDGLCVCEWLQVSDCQASIQSIGCREQTTKQVHDY